MEHMSLSTPPIQLSKRELQVLDLVSQGLTTSEIASSLFISNHTVNSHRKNMLEKLNVRNVAQLVRTAFQAGFFAIGISIITFPHNFQSLNNTKMQVVSLGPNH